MHSDKKHTNQYHYNLVKFYEEFWRLSECCLRNIGLDLWIVNFNEIVKSAELVLTSFTGKQDRYCHIVMTYCIIDII